MRPFTLLIKPAGADCNIRCAYCFYLEKAALYPDTPVHRMKPEVLERLIRSYMATEQPQYAFGWQGGEPTLMGLDFFREVTRLQEACGRPGAVVANGFQTNGLLLDDAWAEHLARYNFLLGVSVDGPADIHDAHRRDASGRGTHARVMASLKILARHRVAHNALVLVTAANSGRPADVFRFLCDQGLMYHQYVPGMEFDGEGRLRSFSVRGGAWGDFLCGLFDEWLRFGVRRVSVRLFDSVLMALVTGRPSICHMQDRCDSYFLVEHTGDVYPCDFFAQPELRLGNIMAQSWEDLLASPRYAAFAARKRAWHEACTDCEFAALCAGDCLKHRWDRAWNTRAPSRLCAGWKKFYRHALPELRRLAAEIVRERAAASGAVPSAPAGLPGRNDPCPCGSGRKFKKCCGAGR
jgi:uncharacterized protein